MSCRANCKLGETVEHSVSSVLEASVSGVVLPRTTHVCCANVEGKESLPIHSQLSPNPILKYVMRQHCIYNRVDSISLKLLISAYDDPSIPS